VKNYPSEEFFKFAFHTSGHETQSSFEGILINEIIRISRIGEFSGMLTVIALANALSIEIQQIYPQRPGMTEEDKVFYIFSNMVLKPFKKLLFVSYSLIILL